MTYNKRDEQLKRGLISRKNESEKILPRKLKRERTKNEPASKRKRSE
jgi:hypothetical protein